MTEPTTIQVRAINPRPAAPRADKPTVHIRSAAALVGNIAAATGETVFAVGGGVALAATAAAVVGVPLAVRAARGHTLRPAGAGRKSGGGSSGRSTGRGGRLLGSSPSSTGRRPAAGGAGGGAGAGRKSPGGGPAAGGNGSTGRHARVAGDRPSVAGRLGQKLREACAWRAARPMSARKARRRAEREAWKTLGLKPPPGRIKRGAQWLWSKVWSKPAPAVATTPVKPGKTAKAPKVATTVKGSKTATPPAAATFPAPTPNPAPLTPATPPATPGAQPRQLVATAAASNGTTPGGNVSAAPSAMKAMLDVIESDLRRIANNYDPTGIEEVLAEYERWPEVLRAVASVWGIVTSKAEDDYPLPPAAAAVIDEIRKHQLANAAAAEAVPGLVRAIIRERLDAMADKRNAMLDHRANPNTAAM